MAYCQSEIYVEYMAERFGDEAIHRLLEACRDNHDMDAAIERALGVPVAQFEAGYATYLANIAARYHDPSRTRRSFRKLKTDYQQHPDDPDTAAELARAYLERGDAAAAGELARGVLAQTPGHTTATYVRAKLLASIGERADATKLLVAAIQDDEPHPDVLRLLASLHLRDRKYDAARSLLEQGAALEPHVPTWKRSLAAVALKTNDQQRLAELLEELAAGEAENAGLRRKLAQLASQRNDHPAALRWATEVTHIRVSDTEMQILRAAELAREKRYPAAATAYEVAFATAPRRLELLVAAAEAWYLAGQTQNAAKCSPEGLRGGSRFRTCPRGPRPIRNEPDRT